MATPLITYASESAHWYTAEGKACHTVLAKGTGLPRPATLRDARKLNLFPSVTGILGEAARPGLERWKREQVLLAALTLPREATESERQWLGRVIEDSESQAKKAAEEGTRIHKAIQLSFEGGLFDLPYGAHVAAVRDQLLRRYGDLPWITEHSFAHPAGFGGCTDLHYGSTIVDFKGKDFGIDDTLDLFNDHPMQLAGYAWGLGIEKPDGAIMFVSRTSPGIVQLVECTRDDMVRGLAMFKTLLAFWQARTGHVPVWPHTQGAA